VYLKMVTCLTFSFFLIIEFLKYDFEHLLFHWLRLVDTCVASREIIPNKIRQYIFVVCTAI